MADITYISSELIMEGTLDVTAATGSAVVVAGQFKGEMRANEVHLEQGSLFEGKIFAKRVEVSGKIQGEIETQSLKLAPTARMDGSIKTDELAIDVGAEISGSIARLTAQAGKAD